MQVKNLVADIGNAFYQVEHVLGMAGATTKQEDHAPDTAEGAFKRFSEHASTP
jgi:hypothetical protein